MNLKFYARAIVGERTSSLVLRNFKIIELTSGITEM